MNMDTFKWFENSFFPENCWVHFHHFRERGASCCSPFSSIWIFLFKCYSKVFANIKINSLCRALFPDPAPPFGIPQKKRPLANQSCCSMEFFIKRRETWIWFVCLCLELNKGGLNTVNKIKKYIPWKLLDGYISSTLGRGASCWSHQGAISELYSTEYSSHYPDDFATNAKPRHANFVCIRTSASRKNRSKTISVLEFLTKPKTK